MGAPGVFKTQPKVVLAANVTGKMEAAAIDFMLIVDDVDGAGWSTTPWRDNVLVTIKVGE